MGSDDAGEMKEDEERARESERQKARNLTSDFRDKLGLGRLGEWRLLVGRQSSRHDCDWLRELSAGCSSPVLVHLTDDIPLPTLEAAIFSEYRL